MRNRSASEDCSCCSWVLCVWLKGGIAQGGFHTCCCSLKQTLSLTCTRINLIFLFVCFIEWDQSQDQALPPAFPPLPAPQSALDQLLSKPRSMLCLWQGFEGSPLVQGRWEYNWIELAFTACKIWTRAAASDVLCCFWVATRWILCWVSVWACSGWHWGKHIPCPGFSDFLLWPSPAVSRYLQKIKSLKHIWHMILKRNSTHTQHSWKQSLSRSHGLGI